MAKMQLEENIGYFSFSLLMLFFLKVNIDYCPSSSGNSKIYISLNIFGYNIFSCKINTDEKTFYSLRYVNYCNKEFLESREVKIV